MRRVSANTSSTKKEKRRRQVPLFCMRDGQVTPCPSLFQVFQKAEAQPKPGVSIEKHP